MRAIVPLLFGVAVMLPAEAARVPAAAEQAIRGISAGELRAHVETLADDAMAGRGVGQAGNQQAVQYVASALQRAGVPPAGGTYLQPFELYQASLGRDAKLTILEDGLGPIASFTAGGHFYPLPQSAARPATGRLVFAGHGISAPRQGHDDYARLDAHGAVVLALDDAPERLRRRPGLTDEQRVELATVDRKLADAIAHGAAGLIVVRRHLGDATAIWPQTRTTRSATYRLYSRMASASLPLGVISEDASVPIRRAIDRRAALTATLEPDIGVQRLTAHNVIGILPGGAPAEFVVIGAHLDHDGRDESGNIYNGADDNASGTAAVLSIARALAQAAARGHRPRRGIVFALWNAEEQGSLGAEAYLDSPVPSGRIVAKINLDMVGRGEASDHADTVHLLGYSYSPELAAMAKRANRDGRLRLKEAYDRGAGGLLMRSDNWPFLKRGIPALFFTTGIHEDYHTPADDPERLDYAKLEDITELVGRLAWMVADGDPPAMRRR